MIFGHRIGTEKCNANATDHKTRVML